MIQAYSPLAILLISSILSADIVAGVTMSQIASFLATPPAILCAAALSKAFNGLSLRRIGSPTQVALKECAATCRASQSACCKFTHHMPALWHNITCSFS